MIRSLGLIGMLDYPFLSFWVIVWKTGQPGQGSGSGCELPVALHLSHLKDR